MSVNFTRQEYIDAALKYLGTKYHHQGRPPKDGGIDCIGLIVCPLSELGLDVSYIPNTYGRLPNGDMLITSLKNSPHAKELSLEEMAPGDILVFTIGLEPRHFGILLENRQFLHSYYKQSVLMSDLNAWEPSLHSVWRIPFKDEVA